MEKIFISQSLSECRKSNFFFMLSLYLFRRNLLLPKRCTSVSPSPHRQRYFPIAMALFSSPSYDSESERIGEEDMEEEDAWYENLDVLTEDGNDLYGDDTEED